MMPPSSPRKVCAWILRQHFNEANVHQRGIDPANSEIRAELRDSYPAPAAANKPPRTMSEYWLYYTREGQIIAQAHCYRLPDGSIDGGRPDPKLARVGQEILIPHLSKPNPCPGCGKVHNGK